MFSTADVPKLPTCFRPKEDFGDDLHLNFLERGFLVTASHVDCSGYASGRGFVATWSPFEDPVFVRYAAGPREIVQALSKEAFRAATVREVKQLVGLH